MEVKKIRYGNASGVEILTDEQMKRQLGGKYDGDCKVDDFGYCDEYGVYQPNFCIATTKMNPTLDDITWDGSSMSLAIIHAGEGGWWCCNCIMAKEYWGLQS